MNSHNNKSLLENITSDEVEDLIFEHELTTRGYKFHYAIDNYDISKYAFPFGLVDNSDYDERSERTIEIITDEQISYDYLFNIRKENAILLNEHQEELNDFQNKIERLKNFGIKLIDAFKKQAEYFESLNTGKSISFDAWSKNQQLSSDLNVSLLISIALGSLRNGMEKLTMLSEEKLIYRKNDYDKLKFDLSGRSIEECKPREVTELLFAALVNTYKDAAPQRLIARYNKCKVFDRILCINKKANSKNELFLLLSSAKSMNERLPKITNSLGLTLKIDEKYFNPIRSIQQIYLQLLLKDDSNIIDELKKMKAIITLKEKEDDYTMKELVNEMMSRYFENKLSKLREGYENTSLLLKFENYRDTLQTALKDEKISSFKVVSNSINELIKISNEKQELEKLKSTTLSNLEFVGDYNSILKSALYQVISGVSSLDAFAGHDYIENAYHTIPFVFFHGDKDFKDIIHKIIQLTTESSLNKFTSKNLIDSINQSFTLLYHKTLPSEQERIIMLLILMMLSSNKNYDPNNLAQEWIDEMFTTKSISKSWITDFEYIKTWIYRRMKKYEDAILIASHKIKNGSEDPRFYHSLYLSYYCLYRQDSKIDYLNESYLNCEKAYLKYSEIKSSDISIQKTLLVNLNSLAYLSTLLYIETKDVKRLILARQFLDRLKKSDDNYCKFSEFLHTESLLELKEYELSKISTKLKFALKAIELAIKINPKANYLQMRIDINALLLNQK